MPVIGIAAPKSVGIGLAVGRGGVADFGQDLHGDVEEVEDLAVPASLADVVEQRARGVGGVGGVDLAAGQAIDEPAVDRAEGEFAFLGARRGAGDVVEQPGELGAGEIGIEEQARFRGHHLFAAFVLEAGAEGGGAAVLPDDRGVRRPCRSCGPTAPSFRAGW